MHAQNKEPMYVYMADGKLIIGGLADRLRAIISIYDYCKRNSKLFRIFFNHPFFLEDYFVPNKYNWRIEPSEISYNKQDSMPVVIYESEYAKDLEIRLLEKKRKQIHIYSNIHVDIVNYSELFHFLFKPSEKFSRCILCEQEKIGLNYISVSFRFLGLLGDFVDTVKENLISPENQEELINKCITIVSDLKKKHIDIAKILITADSNRFINRISIYDYVYTVAGPVVHTAIKTEENAGYLKTFLDFFLIGNARKAYFVQTKYASGFSYMAAKVNEVPYEIIKM
ncbi:hypothetical protein FACS1894137_12310 [Spirochaetia bacterium]|nr:hypothetical protein FACS1894137_12310 [Spirochaetia bacterium]